MTGLLRTRHPHVAGSGRPAASDPAAGARGVGGRGGLAASFFYLDFDVAPLSLRLAKTDSLPQELLRRRPSKNRKAFGLGRNGCGVVAPATPAPPQRIFGVQ
jgi:hypothetical protein